MRDPTDTSPIQYPWDQRAEHYRGHDDGALAFAAEDIRQALACAEDLCAAGYRHRCSFYADEQHTVATERRRRAGPDFGNRTRRTPTTTDQS